MLLDRIHLPVTARAIVRRAVRSSLPRPAAAAQAADEFQRTIWAAVTAEIRWAFTPPRAWLSGVAVNLALSLMWLLVQPVRAEAHRDWVILIGTYFSSFILADVTTTNVLGVDNVRVQKAVHDGTPVRRILLAKNIALLVIVGLPTLVAAVALTLCTEAPSRVLVTIPDVTLPILAWLGVGNLVSAMFPVGYEPLIRRWRQRRDVKRTMRWLAHLALPYVLFYLADPIYGAPRTVIWHDLPAVLGPGVGPVARSLTHVAAGFIAWLAGIGAAEIWVRVRGMAIQRRHLRAGRGSTAPSAQQQTDHQAHHSDNGQEQPQR